MKFIALVVSVLAALPLAAQPSVTLRLSRAEYQDRVQAGWTAQILATLMGFPFEHKVASTVWIDRLPKPYDAAPVDDDYYYELVALRAFEKYGPDLTLEQLAAQWKENSAGSWGSSEQTRLLLAKGLKGDQAGHPRRNRLWFSIGPQFSGDIYGLLAPGMPNLAGELARRYGHINGYAEGTDGAVFIAGMVSLAFRENDPRRVVSQAARLLPPASPYRQCLDMLIGMAQQGRQAREIFDQVEDRWHIEYPATNNAVANGGIVATAVWFGEGDFLKTINLVFGAADFTDADCNAANAGAVVGAMRGMQALPAELVRQLNDRITGSKMGPVELTPPVEERISDVARRTAAMGYQLIARRGASVTADGIAVPEEAVVTQAPERFRPADLMQYWNPEWTLERAGFGGAGGGLRGVRGITHLDGDVLATYPRDEVRGLLMRRAATLGEAPSLSVEAGADPGRAWLLEIYANNDNLFSRVVECPGGEKTRCWEPVQVDLGRYRGQTVQLRLYQRVLVADKVSGNAYWRGLRLQ